MANTREIRNRIGSVKSTAKITKALQLVSAAKMQKAQDRSKQASLYSEVLFEIVNKIGNIKDYKSPYLQISKSETLNPKIAIVVIGTDRGFVGSMISNLIIGTYNLKNELLKKYPEAKISGISMHKTGLKIIQNAGIDSTLHFSQYKDNPTQTDLTSLFSYLIEKFKNEEFDSIYLVNTKFINTLAQRVEVKKVLPISLEEIGDQRSEISNTTNHEPLTTNPFTFEPSQEEILEKLLPEYFQTIIYTALLSSIASEYSSRMVAMKNATDNANDLVTNLTLKYNKTRQASITQQIIEIVSGSI